MTKRSSKSLLLICFSVLLFIVGCSKNAQRNVDVNIYISGIAAVQDTNYKAVYWKNGNQVDLNSHSRVSGITTDGNDVYICGNYNNNMGYWKNGTFITVFPNVLHLNITAMAVKGNDIYMVGYNEYYKSVCWKNGKEIGHGGNAIAVVGDDIYVAGSFDDKAIYWKNDQYTFIGGPKSGVLGISITDGNIYMSGYSKSPTATYSVATVWKNGTQILVADTASEARGVAVYNNDVYMAGIINRNPYAAAAWKNKALTILPENPHWGSSSSANAIASLNGDVYIAGQITNETTTRNNAVYWKNGILNVLNNNTSLANGIVVAK